MARTSDQTVRKTQMQRLAIAAGVTLSDGSPVVVGGDKCPPTRKIKDAIGFTANRMSRQKFQEAKDDFGAVRPYYAPQHEGNDAVASLLKEWSGMSDCDGEMDLETLLQITG